MTDYEQMNDDAKAAAVEASQEGNFSFLDRLAGRDYPTEDVEIYLDEAAGHRISALRESLKAETDADKTEELIAQIEAQRDKARKSRYIVRVQGISIEDWDSTIDEANEHYPVQYEESTHPLTMAKVKNPIPSEERETFFRTHSWAKFIQSVTDADGNVDSNITPEWVAVFLNQAPIVAIAKVAVAIDKVRMTTEWMDQIQGDDFLAKS